MKSRGPTRRSVLALLAAGPAVAQTPAAPQLQTPTLAIHALSGLKSEHPRLLLSDEDLERLRGIIHDLPQAHKLYLEMGREADRLQTVPPVEYKSLGPRATLTARTACNRIYTLALLYRLDRKRTYLDRAAKELRAIAAFRDWNTGRFIDTAELTNAMAIGYDWLFGALSPDDRQTVRDAIVEKGLDPAIPIYERQISWTTNHLYWNPVCNGGITMGALAVAEDDMQKCEAIVRFAVESLPRALFTYGPEGAWPEGESYWNYATRYVALMLGALDSAVGTDFGLGANKRLEHTGRYRVYTTGPTTRVFNFGDATEDDGSVPEMFWLARKVSQPVFAWQEARHIEKSGHTDPLDLVWYDREQRIPSGPNWPLHAIFPALGVATFRSTWEDPDALFLATAARDNKSPRAHLDLGSFILEAGGVRWAIDLGPDDYANASRPHFSYYRTRTEAHNTLTIDGENQDPRADARITRHEFTPDLAWVQFDLAHAYPGKVKMLQRRIGIAERQAVLIQDSLRADQPVEAVWGMVTDADVTLSGQRAELRKDNWILAAEIITPRHALFDIESTHSQPPQNPNAGTRKLIARLGEKVTDLELNIVLTPYRAGQAKPKVSVKFPVT
ncbi:MAG TPA: heparinase II/III family protein [Bryobacteraceae bacterium]